MFLKTNGSLTSFNGWRAAPNEDGNYGNWTPSNLNSGFRMVWDSITSQLSISLSNFIKNNFSKDDFIVLKFNVECSEYDVIQTALYISNYGDISSVRRAVKFVNEHYDKNIVCKISQSVKQNL